jgi:hypothetical protein
MDPITLAVVSALGKMSEQAIHDGYQALKAVIVKKFGAEGKLPRSVQELEEEPNSRGRKYTLEEQVAFASAHKDPKVLNAAQTLLALIEKSPGKPVHSTVIKQQAGDNAFQVGQVGRDFNNKK